MPSKLSTLRLFGAMTLCLLLLGTGCSMEDFLRGPRDPQDTTVARPSPTPTTTPTATPYIDDMLSIDMLPQRNQPHTRPNPTPTAVPEVNLLHLLPGEDLIPSELRLTRELPTMSIDQAVQEADGATDYARLLREWGFKGGSMREYQYPNPDISAYLSDRLLGFEARAMQFATGASAVKAIEFQRDWAKQRADWDLSDTTVENLGDTTVALKGTANVQGTSVQVVAIFVQDGNTVYRFVGIGGLTDPMAKTLAIAKATLN